MLPDRVSNPGPLTYESGALPSALRGPAPVIQSIVSLTKSLVKDSLSLSVYTKLISVIFFEKKWWRFCV